MPGLRPRVQAPADVLVAPDLRWPGDIDDDTLAERQRVYVEALTDAADAERDDAEPAPVSLR